jgi:diguanylate cyclase (GGDEF)-like protein
MQEIAHVSPLLTWLRNDQAELTAGDIVAGAVLLAAAAVAYYLPQTLIIGIARGFNTGTWSYRAMAGTRAQNVELMLMVAAGVVTAAAASPMYGLLLVGACALAVAATRLAQRAEELTHEAEQLQADALHDALTKLPNRRGFDPAADLALVTDDAHGKHTAVLMCDLDHFKQWNTDLGHLGADQLLIAVAAQLQSLIRKQDLICRWGGEEIAMLLPGASAQTAWETAERICQAIREMRPQISRPAGGHPITIGQGKTRPCTISIGIAIAPIHGATLINLQEAADQALQHAKDNGRNQARIASIPTVAVPGMRNAESSNPFDVNAHNQKSPSSAAQG